MVKPNLMCIYIRYNMRHSIEPKDRVFIKGYVFLSLFKNLGKNIGKNIRKNLINITLCKLKKDYERQ